VTYTPIHARRFIYMTVLLLHTVDFKAIGWGRPIYRIEDNCNFEIVVPYNRGEKSTVHRLVLTVLILCFKCLIIIPTPENTS